MRPEFHARYSATSRRYAYHVGTDEDALSPFRRRTEWAYRRPFSRRSLDDSAALIVGDHSFVAFAVRNPATDGHEHRCRVFHAEWRDRQGGVTLDIEANRFLHHMVRFLVGTMFEVASGRRDPSSMATLLAAGANDEVSPPAPARGLVLERVCYPDELYVSAA
jgi:tRNA pseudouridine38-40 synthase